jgi:REP element-mobilizing transposase RayT
MGKAGFRGWHERSDLPHYDVPNDTQSVTFRLADSLPREVQARIEAISDDRERRKAFEAELDRGHGACFLHRRDIAGLVENALRFFHGQRYELRAWCVMPNHIHVMFRVVAVSMSEIMDSWKSYTGLQANRLLKREGQPFWQAGYFDTYIRNSVHESQTVRYIEQNPCKGKLVLDPKEWPWSSARLRDEFARLHLPIGSGQPKPRSAPILGAAAPPAGDATSNCQVSSKTDALRPGRPRSGAESPTRDPTH